jgi:hypothetical protein
MLLIIILVLIAKLASVCDSCDNGTQEVDDLDWTEEVINVLTQFLKQTAVKTAAWIYILFAFSFPNPEFSISDSTFE